MRSLFFAALMLMTQNVLASDAPRLYFVNLADGDVVSSPVKVIFGLEGMGVAPAGINVDGTGHHHLLINTTLAGEALKQPIPADEQHVHFGKGQTETTVELGPGEHTLQLLLGNFVHVPHDPPIMSELITIRVE